jgi:ferric-dicitrate binding protein FerR (iron transport regulator)
MKRTNACTALLVALALAAALAVRGHGQTQYSIQMVVGDVKIISGGKTAAAAVDRALAGGDTIVTGYDSMADVSFGDRGLVRVQESTKVTVASLKKNVEDPDLDLDSGGILVMLSKLVKGESFRIRTSTQVASVRGTSFQVTSEGDGSRVDVLDGKIMVNPVADGALRDEIREYVSENQSISLDRGAVREILAKRRKMIVSELKEGDLDKLVERFNKIRESRGYKRLNRGLRGEFENRINKMRKRRADRGNVKPVNRQEIRQRIRQRRSLGR